MRWTTSLAVMLLAIALAMAVGCQPVNLRDKVNELRGQGFEDETSKSLGQMRKADPDNKKKWGWTTKAQEIEDNLGVR